MKTVRQTHKSPTQLEELIPAFSAFVSAVLALDEPVRRMQGILDRAQNSPPDGGSDGSISEDVFNRMRRYEMAAQQLLESVARSEAVGRAVSNFMRELEDSVPAVVERGSAEFLARTQK